MSKYRNRCRKNTIRLKNYDYSSEGYYFVTIVTKFRKPIFARISQGNVFLSTWGKIVQEEWERSFQIRENMYSDIFVVMPDHVHGIVAINRRIPPSKEQLKASSGMAYRAPNSLSSLIAGFKASVTRRINQQKKTSRFPVWQRGYHESVICNDEALFRIRRYIENNPANWKES